MITGDQVKEAMLSNDITRVDHHHCGLCGDMVFYSREGDQLYFNPGCSCVRPYNPPEPRSWDDPAKWINMQTNDEVRTKIAKRFGITL